jgi:hypothetical protein
VNHRGSDRCASGKGKNKNGPGLARSDFKKGVDARATWTSAGTMANRLSLAAEPEQRTLLRALASPAQGMAGPPSRGQL